MAQLVRLLRSWIWLGCALLAALVGGCGGGGSGGGTEPLPALQGVFIDSPVQGLGYESAPSGLTGITNDKGQFDYRSGDRVTFRLFGRVVGTGVPAAPVVTVLSVFGATSVSDPRVVNLARLLLTLGGIPAAGANIVLPAAAPAGFPATIDFAAAGFEATFPNLTLLTEAAALAHLSQSFARLSVASIGTGAASGRITSEPAGIDCGLACEADYLKGTRITLVASSAGFAGWSGVCQGSGACIVTLSADALVLATFTSAPPTANLVVAKAGSGSGRVTSNPAGIDCGTTCAATLAPGAVALTAVASAGSTFAGWSNGSGNASCAGTGTCDVPLAVDSAIVATFTLNAVPVSVTAQVATANSGGGTVSCSANGAAAGACGSYAAGTQVTLTAQPNTFSVFTGWSGGGCTGTGTCTVTVTSDVVVTANFNRPTLTLQITGTGGVTSSPAGINCAASCSAVFDRGVVVTLTPAGTGFTGWSGGECTGTATCTVTMNQSISVSATFVAAAFPHFAPQASLALPNVNFSSGFGNSVAVSGDTMVVGTPGDASNARGIDGDPSNLLASGSGAVHVYTRSAGAWTHQAYVKASNSDAGDSFGSAVAISGDTLVVGAPGEDSAAVGVDGDQAGNAATGSGAVYVFTRTGGVWTQQAYLKAPNTGAGDAFGASVAVSGDTVVVGARLEDSAATGVGGGGNDNSMADSGAAYVFTRTGTAWQPAAYLKASNTAASYEFGFSVAVSGSTVAVGSHQEGSLSTGVNATPVPSGTFGMGAVYVFTASGGTWSQQAYVKASNTSRVSAAFGWSVALSGDTLAVGAPKESNFATGINPSQGVPGSDSGAAYVFTRTGSTWLQQVYVKASNTGLFDDFGWSVALSGDTLAVGSPFEDSSATGVNGDQRNDNVSNPGAGYVFRRAGTTWSQVDYVKSANTVPGGIFGNSLALSQDTLVVGAAGEFRGAVYVFAVP